MSSNREKSAFVYETEPGALPRDVAIATPRIVADGLKLAMRELAEEDPAILRHFMRAVFGHINDGISSWFGKKLMTMLGIALFSAALWFISKGGTLK